MRLVPYFHVLGRPVSYEGFIRWQLPEVPKSKTLNFPGFRAAYRGCAGEKQAQAQAQIINSTGWKSHHSEEDGCA